MATAQRVAIVTGASRGIGRGIASVLARDSGYIVYATARSEASLNALAAEIGPNLVPIVVNHSSDDSTRALVERVMRDHGRLDALVNNAYGGVAAIADHFGKRFWEKPLSQWDASHDVGLRSHYIASCLAVPNMLSSGGLIVNISSGGGAGYLFDPAYGAGKQALDRLTCDMAVELQGTGVRAVTLWPGPVNTESTSFPFAESVEFSGRAIAALLEAQSTEPAYLDRINGKIVLTAEVSERFGFGDTLGGKGSSEPHRQSAAARRKALEAAGPVHWRLDAELPELSSANLAVFFESGKSDKSKIPGKFATNKL